MTSVPYMTTTPTASTTSRAASCTKMAAALPRKMPAGSRPDRRRASRPPSAASMVKARWIASRLQNSTATQKSPALARARIPRSGSRATPNRISTRMANGRHLLRGDLRAQLDPQVLARDQRGVTEQGRGSSVGGGGRGRVGGAAGDRDDPVGERLGAVELVRRQEHGGARPPTARRTRSSSRSRPSWSSPACGSSSSHSSGRRATRHASDGAPPLAGRQARHREVGQPAVEPARVERGVDVLGRARRRPGPRTARCRRR